tara:strand:- start:83 stop:1138 length:1056 start_codon:yes stop_codon:yes gene_type:complete
MPNWIAPDELPMLGLMIALALLIFAVAALWWRSVYRNIAHPDPAAEAAVMIACKDRLALPDAMKQVGIFRVPGGKVEVDALLRAAKGGGGPDFAASVARATPNVAASLLKAVLRLRPTPLLFPAMSVFEQIDAASRPTNGDAVVAGPRGIDRGVLASGGTGTIVLDDLDAKEYEVVGVDGTRTRYRCDLVAKSLRGGVDDVAAWGVEGVANSLLGEEQQETAKLVIALLVHVVEEPANRMDATSLIACFVPTLLHRPTAADIALAGSSSDAAAAARALHSQPERAAAGFAALLNVIVEARARAHPDAWRRHTDGASGDTFYEYVATGETSWSLPPSVADALVQDAVEVDGE